METWSAGVDGHCLDGNLISPWVTGLPALRLRVLMVWTVERSFRQARELEEANRLRAGDSLGASMARELNEDTLRV